MATVYQVTPRFATRAPLVPMPPRPAVNPRRFCQALDAIADGIDREEAGQRATCAKLGGRWDDEDESLMQDFRDHADRARRAGDIIRRVHERYMLAMNEEIADALDGAGLTLFGEAYRRGNVSALGFGEVAL